MSFLSAYRASPRYAFHSTGQANATSIRENGVQRRSGKNPDSSDIIETLADLGYDDPFPFDRAAVTYCHVDAAYVESVFQSTVEMGLASDDVIVVVDLTTITSPMYLADMSLITDLIDYRYGGADVMLHAETPEEAITAYRESIAPVESPTDIAAYEGAENGHTELVIEGDIPPSAIADICATPSCAEPQ